MRIVCEECSDRLRLDVYLSGKLRDCTRSRVSSMIRRGLVLLNGSVPKAGAWLKAGDIITVDMDLPPAPGPQASPIELDIIYEDEMVIVVNKPKGMVVHPAPGHTDDTLVNALMYHCGDSLSGIGGVMRPGIVHRIDRDTTGLIIACKNDFAHRRVAQELSRHGMERRYIALCYDNITEDDISIDMPIGRGRADRRIMSVRDPVSPRDAITHIHVLERFHYRGECLCLTECRLETGRTHQIRVHMSALRHPLAGDEVYGRRHDFLKGQGQYLHAATLGFTHPGTGEWMRFEAGLPEYFTKTLDKLRN